MYSFMCVIWKVLQTKHTLKSPFMHQLCRNDMWHLNFCCQPNSFQVVLVSSVTEQQYLQYFSYFFIFLNNSLWETQQRCSAVLLPVHHMQKNMCLWRPHVTLTTDQVWQWRGASLQERDYSSRKCTFIKIHDPIWGILFY